jgi:hypothetical protein
MMVKHGYCNCKCAVCEAVVIGTIKFYSYVWLWKVVSNSCVRLSIESILKQCSKNIHL